MGDVLDAIKDMEQRAAELDQNLDRFKKAIGTMDKFSYQMRLIKTKDQPKAAKGRKWRWDLDVYENVDGKHPGVKDTRVHLGGGGFGYARTRRAALRQIGKAYDNAQKRFPIYG